MKLNPLALIGALLLAATTLAVAVPPPGWTEDYAKAVEKAKTHSTPQSAKVKQQNGELKSKFPVSGYPTVVVVDPEGKQLSRSVGYKVGSGPAAYLEKLKGTSKE